MPIKFILDTREKHLQRFFDNNSIPYETRQLDLGDILVLYSKGEIQERKIEMSDSARKLLGSSNDDEKSDEPTYTIVIERKSYTDLKASMADGRYHEQKARYKQLPRGTVYYILEANDPSFKELDRKQYLGMYVHTILRDDIPIFHTRSLEDTFEFIVKIGATLEQFGFDGKESKACTVETSQIKKKRAEGKDVYKQQLCCFSGISSGKADAIVAVYPNIVSLIKAVETDTFKVKGIGAVLLQKIKEGLLLTEVKQVKASLHFQ